jgi:hypothetical protein
MELPPDFDGDAPQTKQVLEDGMGTWAPSAQDTDFLDIAPDECPRKSMCKALDIFLRLSRGERLKRQMDTLNFLQVFTQIAGLDIAPHVALRITVASEDKTEEDWYATHFLGGEEAEKGYSRLRDKVLVEEPMKEDAERESSPHDMIEGARAAGEEEGGTGFHASALEFTPEEDVTLIGADQELRRIHGAEARLGGLRLGEALQLPRRPLTAQTHEEVRSRLSSGRESLERRGASGKEASLLARVREDSTQEESDREANDFEICEGLETIEEVLGYFVRKWRSKVDGEQTRADLNERLRAHPPYAPLSIPPVAPDSKIEVMKASTIFGAGARKEFVFRKGVQTRNAPQIAPASEAALAWLAEKARTVLESVREGSKYYFPYTHEVFRRLLAKIYNPMRLADLAGPAPTNTSAMADLVGRFAFCTKGNSQDFKVNVYHGAVVVCFRAERRARSSWSTWRSASQRRAGSDTTSLSTKSSKGRPPSKSSTQRNSPCAFPRTPSATRCFTRRFPCSCASFSSRASRRTGASATSNSRWIQRGRTSSQWQA